MTWQTECDEPVGSGSICRTIRFSVARNTSARFAGGLAT